MFQHERKRLMTVENMNGIDVPALKTFVDRVKTDPDQRTVAFQSQDRMEKANKNHHLDIGLHDRR